MKLVGQTHDRLGTSCPNPPRYQYPWPSSSGGTFTKTTCGKHTPPEYRKEQHLIPHVTAEHRPVRVEVAKKRAEFGKDAVFVCSCGERLKPDGPEGGRIHILRHFVGGPVDSMDAARAMRKAEDLARKRTAGGGRRRNAVESRPRLSR